MDFHPVAIDTASNILPAVKYILGLDISPDDKKSRIAEVITSLAQIFIRRCSTPTAKFLIVQ